MTGKIKNLCRKKGADRDTFGFIHGEDGVDRFFLPTALVGGTDIFSTLRPDMLVEFEHVEHDKGARAGNIRIVSVQ